MPIYKAYKMSRAVHCHCGKCEDEIPAGDYAVIEPALEGMFFKPGHVPRDNCQDMIIVDERGNQITFD